MVSLVDVAAHVPPDSSVDRKKEEDYLSDLCERISKYLDIARVPFKGVSALFAWAEAVPFKSEWADYIVGQRMSVKLISTTFNLPKFLIKVHALYQTCDDLRKTVHSQAELDMARLIKNIKNIFYKTSSLAISSIKIPLMFDKTGLIDLSKISRTLSDKLSKAENLISLSMYSMKLVNSSMALRALFKDGRAYKAGPHGGLSPKANMAIIKVVSNTIKIISTAASSAALFLSVYFPPVVLVALTSLSFGVSLTSKVVRHSNLIWDAGRGSRPEGGNHLPA